MRSLTTADIERMKADIIAGKTAKPRKIEGRGGVARQPSLNGAHRLGDDPAHVDGAGALVGGESQ